MSDNPDYPQWVRDMAYDAWEAKQSFQDILTAVIWGTYRQSMIDMIDDIWVNRHHPDYSPSLENEAWAYRTTVHLMAIAEEHCGFNDKDLIALVEAQASPPGFAAWLAERDRLDEEDDA